MMRGGWGGTRQTKTARVVGGHAQHNTGAKRSPDQVSDTGCGRCAGVAAIWCKIVLCVEAESIRIGSEECGDVLKNDIAAIEDCHRLVGGECGMAVTEGVSCPIDCGVIAELCGGCCRSYCSWFCFLFSPKDTIPQQKDGKGPMSRVRRAIS